MTETTEAPKKAEYLPDFNRGPIIVFKGGGYSGCLWEWNCIAFHKSEGDGKLKPDDVNVTGWAGKKVRAAFHESFLKGYRAAKEEGDMFVIRDAKSWKIFGDEFNKGFVRSVARFLDLECQCDRCKNWFSAEDIYHTGYRGDGGIGVQCDDNHCYECAEELHEEWFQEQGWKWLDVATRVKAIQTRNEECGGDPVSIFAARRENDCPVSYRDAGDSGPDLY